VCIYTIIILKSIIYCLQLAASRQRGTCEHAMPCAETS
jgi:hypothetical protein